MSESNIVYIGRKPVMTYVLVLIERINRVKSGNIIIKARGRAISTAVDTVEVAKRFLGKDLEISVDIGTEELNQLEGGVRNVSAMEITLTSPTGEDEKEESKVLEETQEPPDTTGKPDESATVEEPALGEAPASSLEEEKPSESKNEDIAPEEEKR